MWFSLIVAGALHGLILLPVILSLAGGPGFPMQEADEEWMSTAIRSGYEYTSVIGCPSSEHSETLFRFPMHSRSLAHTFFFFLLFSQAFPRGRYLGPQRLGGRCDTKGTPSLLFLEIRDSMHFLDRVMFVMAPVGKPSTSVLLISFPLSSRARA
jgi:hypothetical protein